MLGVEGTTESVYRAMLVHPDAGISELAALLEMDDEQVRGQLDALAELSLVETQEPGSGRFLAVAPDEALEVLIAREEERLQARQRELLSSRSAIGDLVSSFVDSRRQLGADGLVEQIEGVGVIRSRLFQLSGTATRSVASIQPGEALSPSATEAAARLDHSLLDRGVALRTVVSETSLEAAHWRDYLHAQVAAGAQIRVHPAPPQLMVVVDDATAVIPRETATRALVLHGPDLLAPVNALFLEIWEASEPLGVAPGTPEGPISEARIRQVVALLAQGHKDEAIARRMGISVRTVRRLVSAAIEMLHAQSRFQAGVLAVQRGWVKLPGARDVAAPPAG